MNLFLLFCTSFFHYFPLYCYCAVEVTKVKDGKIRALLITVENRGLVEDLTTSNYLSLSAVLNMQYAKRHSYDYMFIQGRMNYLRKSDIPLQDSSSISTTNEDSNHDHSMFKYIISTYNVSLVGLPHSRDSKHRISSFNIDLKQFRAASWSKLLVIWYLLQEPTISERYDYIFYLDSDAVLSPEASHRSLDDFFKDADAPGGLEYGSLPSKASILVLMIRLYTTIL